MFAVSKALKSAIDRTFNVTKWEYWSLLLRRRKLSDEVGTGIGEVNALESIRVSSFDVVSAKSERFVENFGQPHEAMGRTLTRRWTREFIGVLFTP